MGEDWCFARNGAANGNIVESVVGGQHQRPRNRLWFDDLAQRSVLLVRRPTVMPTKCRGSTVNDARCAGPAGARDGVMLSARTRTLHRTALTFGIAAAALSSLRNARVNCKVLTGSVAARMMRQRVRVGARTDLDLEQRFPQELLLVGQRQHEHPARPRQSRCIAPQTVHDGCQTGASKQKRVLCVSKDYSKIGLHTIRTNACG